MNSSCSIHNRAGLVAVFCAILAALSGLAWSVNLELAARVYFPSWKLLEAVLPGPLFRSFALISVDLSTVSTLVPLLLFLFPLIQALRAKRGSLPLPAPATGTEWMPYPPHFPYFLIMLGLFGTLYGLLIGLQVSGVEGFVGYRPAADSVSQSLTRLLAGTATAIWSSLIGLVGAFLAAQPVPWIFRRLAGVEQPPETVSLAQTIHSLTMDLGGLAEASRAMRATLTPAALAGFLEKLDAIDLNLRSTAGAAERISAAIEKIEGGHLDQLDALRKQAAALEAISARLGELESIRETGREALNRLRAIDASLEKSREAQAGWTRHMESSAEAARRAASAAEKISGDLPGHSTAIQQKLDGIVESNRDSLRQLREERDSFRRSIAAYIEQEETGKTIDKDRA